MNKIFTRNDLFREFCKENSGESITLLQLAFNHLTDIQIMEYYGMKLLRKGYFYL